MKQQVYAEKYLDILASDVLKLVSASRRSSVSDSLRSMRVCLNGLCNVAYCLVPLDQVILSMQEGKVDWSFPSSISKFSSIAAIENKFEYSMTSSERSKDVGYLVKREANTIPR